MTLHEAVGLLGLVAALLLPLAGMALDTALDRLRDDPGRGRGRRRGSLLGGPMRGLPG